MKKPKKNRQPAIRCPYCGRPAVLRKAEYVYRENAREEYLYVCSGYPACDSYVGVHAGTLEPKGTEQGAKGTVPRGFPFRGNVQPSGRTASRPARTLTAGCRIPSA